MINRLVRLFIQDCDNVTDPAVREKYGVLSGAVGIVLNLLLSAGKFFAGVVTGSIAITADAFNNLSDAGSSVVTLVGFKLAGQKADDGHPFGHGRAEYLSGLAVSMLILLMGVELAKESVGKILRPTLVDFSWLVIGILAVSICVKLYMAVYNRSIGKRLNAPALLAAATDSLSDCVSTLAVLLATLVGHFSGIAIDGWVGILVALFILKGGIDAAKDTINPLLGTPPTPEFVREVQELVLAHREVSGIHDLVVHDYGPGRAMMSFHAEVPADADLLEMHDIIDHIERELKEKHHIETVIHMDPVVNDERTAALRAQVEQLAHEIDPVLSIHDLRITAGPRHTNVLFDVMVPYGFRLTDSQVRGELSRGVKKLSEKYTAVIEVDHSYVEQREHS